MYSRNVQGRFPRDMRIPKNYGGSAFSQISETEAANAETIKKEEERLEAKGEEAAKEAEEKATAEASAPASLFRTPKFNLGLGKLFSRGGVNLGLEELLLIGLILLIAGEGGGDDLVLLLLLLLFVQ